jgi:hypothetical protein
VKDAHTNGKIIPFQPDRLLDIPDNFEGHMMEPYVAASFKKRPKKFVLGNEKMYGGFLNKKLRGAPEYQVFVRAFALNKVRVNYFSREKFQV